MFEQDPVKLTKYDIFHHFQIVVFCTITVIVSFFVKNHDIHVDIPKTNDIAWRNWTNESAPTALYTGLSSETFKSNVDSK